MAYTVKQVSEMSGISVRALRFYDETGLLKPAFHGANGYRFYEEPQLLILQQILFYRELGLELKQVKETLGRADFEKAAALRSHREVLQRKFQRTQTLIGTIDKTITHLKGGEKMKGEEMFAGFSVAAGEDRFQERIKLGGESNDCKVSSRDTDGAMCAFEFTGSNSGPRHLHHDQDEWIYVVQGEFALEVANEKQRLGPGESIFLPRKVAHVWASVDNRSGKILNVYQPAGKIEDFFREIGKYHGKPPIHEALTAAQFNLLFQDHGMDVVGPPLTGQWNVNEDGRIGKTA
jgi:DNA-binding transcriptional MerR regulator